MLFLPKLAGFLHAPEHSTVSATPSGLDQSAMASSLVKVHGTCPKAFQTRATAAPRANRKPCICQLSTARRTSLAEKALKGTTAALLSLGLCTGQPALADLNKFEAAAGGEFGVGTALQFGEAELRG